MGNDAYGGHWALPYSYGEASYAQRLVEKCGLHLRIGDANGVTILLVINYTF
jgi:hypothetical protein